MPWNGLPEDQWDKMDRCVEKVMSDGQDKETAIAICMKSLKGEDVTASAIELDTSSTAAWTYTNGSVTAPGTGTYTVTIGAAPVDQGASVDAEFHAVDEDTYNQALEMFGEARIPPMGEVIAFKNSRLAKAERNANGDLLSSTNLAELASTLAFQPVMSSHGKTSRVVGFYTGGTVQRQLDGEYLMADGLLWLGREPGLVASVLARRIRQSIEAVSERVECSTCGRTYSNNMDYCEHLRPLLAGQKLGEGHSRKHYNMRCRGGALVTNPAGTNAGFNDSMFIVMASELEKEPDEDEDEVNMEKVQELEAQITELQASAEAAQVAHASEIEKLKAEVEAAVAQAEKAQADSNTTIARVLELAEAGMAKADIEALLTSLPSMTAETFGIVLASKREVSELKAAKQHTTQAAKANAVDDDEPKDAPPDGWAILQTVRNK